MTQPNDDDKSGRTFTQADLDRAAAAAADRVTRKLSAQYADYDDLKAAAQAAAGSKSQLDKMQDQLDKMAARAEKAEGEALRSSVAAELGLTPKQARRISGSTREELLADGRELLDDLGIKPGQKSGEDGKKDGDGNGEGAATGDGKDGEAGKQQDDGSQTAQRSAPAGRPKESLRSGAPMSEPKADEMDPLKLAASVAKRY